MWKYEDRWIKAIEILHICAHWLCIWLKYSAMTQGQKVNRKTFKLIFVIYKVYPTIKLKSVGNVLPYFLDLFWWYLGHRNGWTKQCSSNKLLQCQVKAISFQLRSFHPQHKHLKKKNNKKKFIGITILIVFGIIFIWWRGLIAPTPPLDVKTILILILETVKSQFILAPVTYWKPKTPHRFFVLLMILNLPCWLWFMPNWNIYRSFPI